MCEEKIESNDKGQIEILILVFSTLSKLSRTLVVVFTIHVQWNFGYTMGQKYLALLDAITKTWNRMEWNTLYFSGY